MLYGRDVGETHEAEGRWFETPWTHGGFSVLTYYASPIGTGMTIPVDTTGIKRVTSRY